MKLRSLLSEDGLDPRRQNFTVRGESRNMGGFFDGVRGSFGVRRYKHDELDGEEIATSSSTTRPSSRSLDITGIWAA